MPWQRLIDALSSSYFPSAAGKRGRPPIGLERMLRIYFLQQWYALADEALEDAIYDSQAMRDFVGIDLASRACRMRPHCCASATCWRNMPRPSGSSRKSTPTWPSRVCSCARAQSSTPPSWPPRPLPRTRPQRDPKMKQTKKGNQWYFGLKAHIGTDAVTGLTHSVAATSANVTDVTMAGVLVRKDDKRVYGDAGYTGTGKYLDEEKDAPDCQ